MEKQQLLFKATSRAGVLKPLEGMFAQQYFQTRVNLNKELGSI